MATDKKSFILYSDSQGLINQLPDDVAGRLFKHIYSYVNDENPISEELLLNIAFEPIKMQFKRDLKKWEESKDAKSINGKMGNLKRYNLDLYDLVSQNKMTLEEAENVAKSRKASQGDSKQSQSVANVAVNDNVNVNVNVNDNVIKENINTPLAFSFYSSLIDYGFNKDLVSEWLKVRKNKKLTNTKTAFNNFIKEVEKTKQDKNKIIEECIVKSWGGFKAEWVNETKNTDVKKVFNYNDVRGRLS